MLKSGIKMMRGCRGVALARFCAPLVRMDRRVKPGGDEA
jgi:hypothetical protein